MHRRGQVKSLTHCISSRVGGVVRRRLPRGELISSEIGRRTPVGSRFPTHTTATSGAPAKGGNRTLDLRIMSLLLTFF
jgi:hypothetical protein